MLVTITAGLKRHDTLISFKTERKTAFRWVQMHAEQLDSLEIDCGLNTWSWTPTLGWVQYPQCTYTPGKGIYPALRKPIRHGNAYDARHPWSYCMAELPQPNPLSFIDESSPF